MSTSESLHAGIDQVIVSLSFVVACPKGCHATDTVLGAVREQVRDADELIVVEYERCSVETSAELHHVVDTQDEDAMIVAGSRLVTNEVAVIIEDHAVVSDTFAESIRMGFSRPGVNALTFEVRNGTSRSIGSRALFLFDYGLSSASVPETIREKVSASFAIRKSQLGAWLGTKESHEQPAVLRYLKIHELTHEQPIEVASSPVVTHHQDVSILGAMLAVCLNAMRQGALDKQVVDWSAARELSRRRYFHRTSQIRDLNNAPKLLAATLRSVAIAGWCGWWLGRIIGDVNIGRLMTRVHPPAKPARES
jgi:hypothetical protein